MIVVLVMICCVSFQESAVNGPVENGGDVTVSLEEHKQLVQEKEELAEQVKEMEKRLEELKLKNNVRRNTLRYNMELVRTLSLLQTLRDNCWRARDNAATLEKTCDQKLKQAYREAEVGCAHTCVCALCYPPFPPSPFQQRCKAVRAEALTEARDAQKVLPLKPPSPEYALDFSFPPPHSLSFSSCFQMSAWVKRRMFLAPPGWTCLRTRLRSTWST